MLVRFHSTKTESVIMFGHIAVQLIKLMGSTGAVPSAISAEDIPAAVRRLRQELPMAAEQTPDTAVSAQETEAEKDSKQLISLATRAVPLLDILERAGKAKVPVMWESM